VVIRCSVLVLLSFLLLFSGSLWAAETSLEEVEITLDFQNVELTDMISTISELTGKNFVYDDGVRGKVSIVSPRPVSIDEAYQLFTTVLNVKGFTIIPSGKINKIVPTRSAKEDNLPISDGRGLGEQFITRIIELKNLDATVVVDTILRPLMPKTSHVVAHAATNRVVMTDSAANIKRLVKILVSLDRSWDGEQLEIVPLLFSDAEETAALVMQILEGGSPLTTSPRGKVAAATLSKKVPGQVIAYARTNKLMLLGDAKFISQAKTIIAQIDEQADLTRAGVHVYYLEHAEAEGLAETLNKTLAGAGKAVGQKGEEGRLFANVSITADKPTNALIVNATAEDYAGFKELIAQLDIKRKQVFVEALILELSMDALQDIGATLAAGGDQDGEGIYFGASGIGNLGEGASLGNIPGSILSQAVSGLMLGGLFSPVTVEFGGEEVTLPALSLLINLSESDTNVNVLSAPRLMTSNNEEAEIVVGSNVPIITSNSKDNDGNPVNTVERQDAALTLRFTPQITEGGMVRLTVFQETSDVAPTNEDVGNPSDVGPTLTKRLIRNTIVAKDGQTVVLGGLFKTNHQEQSTRTPFLSDIPLLGRLFTSHREDHTKTSLLVFLTPRVIRDSEDLEEVTRQNQQSFELFKQEGGSGEVFSSGRAFWSPVDDVEPAAFGGEK